MTYCDWVRQKLSHEKLHYILHYVNERRKAVHMSVNEQGIPNNSVASKNTLPLSNTPMPVQKNNSDCSVFMLQFIKCFKSAYPYESPSSVIPALNNILPPDLKKHQIKSVLSQ